MGCLELLRCFQMSEFFSLINGTFKKNISVLDRGLAYGDGIFETMRWHIDTTSRVKFSGVEYWERHLERLKIGCDKIKLPVPSKDLLNSYKKKILKKSSENAINTGILKIIITRGVGGRGCRFESHLKPTIIFLSFPAKPINQKLYKSGVKVRLCETDILENKRIAGIKHLNRLDSVIARSEWGDNFFEGLFTDNSGNLLEGTMTNIFFIKKKVLYFPRLKSCGIEGIMSQVIKEKTNLFFKDLKGCNLKFSEVKSFDAMFLTNSIIRVVPVRHLENISFGITDELESLIRYFSSTSKRKNRNLEIS